MYDEDESTYMETTSKGGAFTSSDSRDEPVQDEQLTGCNSDIEVDECISPVSDNNSSSDSESDDIEQMSLCQATTSCSDNNDDDNDDDDNDDDKDDDNDDDDEVLIDDDLWEPVYEGASISTVGAYCVIMEFKRACRLSFSTIAMLLQLLQLLCPSQNKLPKSIYSFKKFFQGQSNPFQRRQFCSNCKAEYQDDQKLCNNRECNSSEPDTLITFDYKKAIRRVLKRKSYIKSWVYKLETFLLSLSR